MTSDLLKEKAHESLSSYLSSLGIDPRKPFRCLSPGHEDKHPSMTFDVRRNRVHCFACGVDWDIFDLVGAQYGLEGFREKARKVYGLLGLEGGEGQKRKALPPKKEKAHPLGDTEAYVRACQGRLAGTDYPARRGLSEATCKRFGLGFDPAFSQGTGGQRWQALVIPTGAGCLTARNTDGAADKKSRIRKVGGSPIFNRDILFEAGAPAFVVEGELDALSVYEAGGEAVALGSTANVQRLLALLTERRPARTLLVAMDRDDSGQKAADDLCEGLKALDITHYRVSLGEEDAQDANDALRSDREGFCAQIKALAAIEQEAQDAARLAYERTSLQGMYQDFLDGLIQGVHRPCVPTGFARLDEQLEGGLYEGLYIVGAISSLGKTSLVLQMADQMALSGQDVLLFSLEMAKAELLAKSLSRMTLIEALRQGLGAAYAKTTRGITVASRWLAYNEKDHNLFHDAAEAYRPATHHLYIHEGVGNIGPREIADHVRRHIQFTGNTPVVIVDYLQILAPYHERATDKQNMDKAVLELKRLSRDLQLPLVVISSFNRSSYKEAVTMEAFKESGAIEYSSDVLIGLQLKGAGQNGFDPTAEKEKDPRQVELVVLKNRHGPAGKRVAFEYYPRFHYFKERG